MMLKAGVYIHPYYCADSWIVLFSLLGACSIEVCLRVWCWFLGDHFDSV